MLMNYIRTGFCLILVILFSASPVFAQKAKPFDPLTDEIRDRLPSLSNLLDSARAHDPYISFRNLQISVNDCRVKETQGQWLRNFGLQGNLGYGTFDYLYNNTLGGQTPANYTTTQTLTQYGVGAYVRFPIFDIVGRNNLVRMAKTESLQAKQMVEVQARDLRERVISRYNDLVMKQHLLKILGKYVETSRINMQMAEKEFANGTITLTEFSRITEIATRAETDFESTRMDFQTAYMLLEEVVGIKLNIY